ncbi:TniB family NTP-binding protein [Rhodoferax antarcticus]|uniref:TniB family NTP-binding protein n=1 Tax=Rhodoferax antarcticus TaxID=81479 RepID=UPI002224467B|nr:TniB family NTP-binding protein [Rhodoferax antarcticus]MCW2313710.1 hypothetical protein [Rhodoferax antarcticus]
MNRKDAFAKLLNVGKTPTDPSPSRKKCEDFTLRKGIVEYPRFTFAVSEIARLHRRGLEANDPQGMLLVAQTGCGKSTVFEYYEKHFPRRETRLATEIPVLRVNTPESPTVKMLAEAILFAMQDPAASKGTAMVKTNRIINLFLECKVELLLIDEFQHFFDGRHVAESKRVSDWLKNLITSVNIPVVLAGLPRAISVVNNNPQLRRRFGAPHYMSPFGFTTEKDQLEFRGVLKGIHNSIPCQCVQLHDANIARSFFYATHGLFDYIVKIVDDAVSRGGTGSNGQVTTEDFAAAFKRSVWMDAPDELNPFSGMTKFRLLTRPLEPFDILDDINRYTSHRTQADGALGKGNGGSTKT